MTKVSSLKYGVALPAVLLFSTPVDANWLYEHWDRTDISAQFRLRYSSNHDERLKDSNAITLRSRVKFETDWLWDDFSSVVEIENTTAFGPVDYSNLARDRGTAGIPEAEHTEFNLFQVDYNRWRDTKLTLGRQIFQFDHKHFVSSLNFWQNEQTMDGLSVTNRSFDGLVLRYAYLGNLNRLSGESATGNLHSEDINFGSGEQRAPFALGDHRYNGHLLKADIALNEYDSLNIYSYLLDNKDLALNSTNTFGVQFKGTRKPGTIQYRYLLEYATQRDAHSNPLNYNANYYRLNLALSKARRSLSFNYEVLGSDGEAGFVLPLGDSHSILGWADRFKFTNTAVRDASVAFDYKRSGVRFFVSYHQFKLDDDGSDLGYETDVNLQKSFQRGRYKITLTFADYRSDGNSLFGDSRKAWLTLSANF